MQRVGLRLAVNALRSTPKSSTVRVASAARMFCTKAEKPEPVEAEPFTSSSPDNENVKAAENVAQETDAPATDKMEQTEKVVGEASRHEFQAETRKLLDIVAKSLYTEKEVMIM